MDKQRWTKVGLEIEKHLQEIRRIARQNNMQLNIAAFPDGNSWATHIDDNREQFDVVIGQSGVVALRENNECFYQKP